MEKEWRALLGGCEAEFPEKISRKFCDYPKKL